MSRLLPSPWPSLSPSGFFENLAQVRLGRRAMLAVPLLGGLCNAFGASRSTPPVLRRREVVMGTAVDIVALGDDEGLVGAAVQAAYRRMRGLEGQFSRFQPDSVISRISMHAGKRAVPVPPNVMDLLLASQRVHALSGGAFDITVGGLKAWQFGEGPQRMPDAKEVTRQLGYVNAQALVLNPVAGTAWLKKPGMTLDMGGIAKLPILDEAMQVLHAHGVQDGLINGGGDVVVSGSMHGRPWRVGLRDPRDPSRLLGVVSVQGQAVVASSGDYERCFFHDGQRMHHVLNPRTGWPSTGVHGVSMVARTVQEVNGLGAALMVMGPAAAQALARRTPGLAMLLAQADGKVWQSSAMERWLERA